MSPDTQVNHFEDFAINRVFRHHWGRTITASEPLEFATQHVIYEPIYFNVLSAKSAGFRDIPVHPLYVFCITLGLSVEDLSESGGPFLGADNMVSLAPVYPGDTLFASSRVEDVRSSQSRRGFGVVRWHTWAVQQDGQKVIAFDRTNLVRRRNAQSATD